VEESSERYLLGPADGNVKIRDDLMDVKVLRETDAGDLERWEPVLKAPFPLGAGDLAVLRDALHLAPATIEGETTLDRLLDDLAGEGIPAVDVRKRRIRSTFAGCMAELSEVAVGTRSTTTLAVESEDRVAVGAAVRELGLGDRLNTSYPNGLRALVEGWGARFAVIDVGTNSVKFHVAERGDDGAFRPIVDRAEVTRLGEGLDDTGEISRAAIERTADGIAGMVTEARATGALALAAVGTAGLRIAANREAVLDAIEVRSGVRVEVIDGEDEARLAYVAATSALGIGEGSVVVFDTGGGSSQFTFGHGSHVDERFSVDVGAARFTERFGLDRAVGDDVVQATQDAIAAELERVSGHPSPEALVGMGGATTNLTAVTLELREYDPGRIQGADLRLDDVDREIERFRALDADGRRSIVGLQPKRAEVILAGACIVRTVMAMLGKDRLTVSDRGLRHGLLAERFGA
jgi:exopolyphosphatase/guanosine-5'-triphosphate,3'-diphosphate pyrophosphatase